MVSVITIVRVVHEVRVFKTSQECKRKFVND